jgi:GntR family transcriptional repressor for pyruvate dehydrogenase complex
MSFDSSFGPIIRARLSDALVERVLASIREGQLCVGERLPTIAEMARRFRVAPATVREALVKLELMGIVDIRHGTGVTVRRQPPDGRAA